MARKPKDETEIKEPVECSTCTEGCTCCKSTKGKIATILVSAIALGAIAFWGTMKYTDLRLSHLLPMHKDDVIVASVDGDAIYMSDVKEVFNKIPQLKEIPFEALYPQLVEKVVANKVFQKAIKGSDVKNNILVQEQINGILAEAYLRDKFSKTITDEELKNIYLDVIKNMPKEDEVHARHIIVKTEKEAKDILIQLKAGADFKILADTKSLDAGSGPGGDLGYIRKGMFAPEFTNALFSLNKGEYSEPVKTAFGWHIFLIEDRREASAPSFEELKEELAQIAFRQKADSLIKDEYDRFNAHIILPDLRKPEPLVVLEDESAEPTSAEPETESEKAPATAQEAEPTTGEAESVSKEPVEETATAETKTEEVSTEEAPKN